MIDNQRVTWTAFAILAMFKKHIIFIVSSESDVILGHILVNAVQKACNVHFYIQIFPRTRCLKNNSLLISGEREAGVKF